MDYSNYADIPFKKIVKLMLDFLHFFEKLISFGRGQPIDFFGKGATNWFLLEGGNKLISFGKGHKIYFFWKAATKNLMKGGGWVK